jgi:hypothetical protein
MRMHSILFCLLVAFAGAVSAQTTWVGSTSTDWGTAANWSTAAVPTAATIVVIASGTTFTCTVAAASSCLSLTINTGATLNGGGATQLDVNGSWTNNGTFSAGTSHVRLVGTASGTIGGTTSTVFNRLTVV